MDDIIEKVYAEFENIEKILTDIEELLSKKELNKHEVNSSAYLLINFYNGIENILKQMLKSNGVIIKNFQYWHKELLDKSLKNNILSSKLHDKLIEYMKFRHYATHNYSFSLNLKLFLNLINNSVKIYTNFKKFIEKNLK